MRGVLLITASLSLLLGLVGIGSVVLGQDSPVWLPFYGLVAALGWLGIGSSLSEEDARHG